MTMDVSEGKIASDFKRANILVTIIVIYIHVLGVMLKRTILANEEILE